LWRDLDFLNLWIGQTISEIGSRIKIVALPLIAVLILNARPFQMGMLCGNGQDGQEHCGRVAAGHFGRHGTNARSRRNELENSLR
jgi:hypothetical protein